MVAPSSSSSPACSSGSGNKVRVVARIRPLSNKEKNEKSHETVSKLQDNNSNNSSETCLVQVNGPDKRWFELDAVLDGTSNQADVYAQSGAKQAVTEGLFDGFNTSILAYGQTGAGKTFTMGTAAADANDETAGMIPRACADLYQTIQDKCVDGKAAVTLSYLELYNEQIRDLFANKPPSTNSRNEYRIREVPGVGVQVQGVVEKTVQSPAEIGAAMEAAGKKRVVAATAMNATSSRSHAICTLKIRGTLKPKQGEASTAKKFSSKLTLVDLAGSERIKKTGAQGARQTEGININKSLLVLGQVVSALSQPGGGRKPPYRDSKLTRLLQDSLGGNSRTIMVACVSPAHVNLEETTNTLRYAASARRITNKARQNVAVTSTLSAEQVAGLRKENSSLQQQVMDLQATIETLQEQLREAKQLAAQPQAPSALAFTEKRTLPSRTLTEVTATLSEDEEDLDNDSSVICSDEDKFRKVSYPAEEDASNDRTEEKKGTATDSMASRNHESMKDAMDLLHQQAGLETGEVQDTDNEEEGSFNFDDDLIDSDEDDFDEDEKDDLLERLSESTATLFKKRETDFFMDISSHKLLIAELQERIENYEEMEQRYRVLQNDFAEVRQEAETSRMAANCLSNIVDELRDIKDGELEKRQQQLQMTVKEQNWISFVQVMLQNYRMQLGQLSMDFKKTVVGTIDNMEFKEKTAVKSEEDLLADEATEGEKEADTSEQPPTSKPNRRRSWWGGTVQEPQAPTILPWKESTEKFDQEIRRIEDMLIAETESMNAIQCQLAVEVKALEKEISEQKAENDNLFASPKDKDTNPNDLVDHLSLLLLNTPSPDR